MLTGWDTKDFNEHRINNLMERFFFQVIRQKGYEDDDPVITGAASSIFRQYAEYKAYLKKQGTFIKKPGGVLIRIATRVANTLPDVEIEVEDGFGVFYE